MSESWREILEEENERIMNDYLDEKKISRAGNKKAAVKETIRQLRSIRERWGLFDELASDSKKTQHFLKQFDFFNKMKEPKWGKRELNAIKKAQQSGVRGAISKKASQLGRTSRAAYYQLWKMGRK